MVQEQTKRVGTVEEYVLAMKSTDSVARLEMLKGCEVTGGDLKWVEGMIKLGQLYFITKHGEFGMSGYSVKTLTNIVKAYVEVFGAIHISLSAPLAKRLFGNKKEMAMLKRILGEAKYTILANCL